MANVPTATVRRSAAVPAIDTGGISVMAAQPSLLHMLSAAVLHGRYLDSVAQRYPEIVLGYAAARTLGIATLTPASQVYVAGQYFVVVGILAPVAAAPEIDDAALVTSTWCNPT